MTSRPGFFLVIDGIDGCGKSTQGKKIFEYFQERNIPCYLTSEPSQGEIGKILRKYLKEPSSPAAVDALLFAADRVEHCEREILPHLQKGEVVISDRYRDSSYVYQTIQGKDQNVELDWLISINIKSFTPDLTIILDLDPKIALQRKVLQNNQQATALEKFEQIEFQKQIRSLFLKIARNNSTQTQDNYRILDAIKPLDTISKEIQEILIPLLKKRGIIL